MIARVLASLLGLALVACGPTSSGTEAGEATATSEASGPKHDPAVAQAIELGHSLFFGKAMCSTCHRVGEEGTMYVGPNLGVGDDMREPVAARLAARDPAADPATYVIHSILDPDAFVVPSYARGVMKSPDDIPIALSDDELVALVAFILSTRAEQAIDPAALERARSQIAAARAARAQRRAGPAAP